MVTHGTRIIIVLCINNHLYYARFIVELLFKIYDTSICNRLQISKKKKENSTDHSVNLFLTFGFKFSLHCM
jgi:hypothetical protein